MCEVSVDRGRLVHPSEFKILGFVLDELGTNGVEFCMKMMSERKVAGALKMLLLIGAYDLNM